jgi:hypothetical protein
MASIRRLIWLGCWTAYDKRMPWGVQPNYAFRIAFVFLSQSQDDRVIFSRGVAYQTAIFQQKHEVHLLFIRGRVWMEWFVTELDLL